MSSSPQPRSLLTIVAIVFTTAVIVTGSGCAKFGLNELLPPREPLQIKGGNTACLQNAGVRISDYLEGRGSTDDISAMFSCADDSIQLFLERTKTSTPGNYQPTELRNFLEKYFFGSGQISNALMAETMEFKRSILGGRGDRLTDTELKSLRRILSGVKDQLIKLAPLLPLTLERLSKLEPREQDQALLAVNQTLAEFGSLLAETAGDYPTVRLEALFREIERVTGSEGLRRFIARLGLVRSLKPVLLGTSQEQFRPEEWPRFLVTMGRIFGILVKGNPLMPDETGAFPVDTSCGVGREKLTHAVLDAFSLIEDAIRYHGSLEMIPFVEVDRVIDTLVQGDIGLVRPITLKRLTRPVFRRFLAGLNEGFLGREAEGITLLGVERARRAFLDWSDNQKYIQGVFSALGRFDCSELAINPGLIPRYSWQEMEGVSVEAAMGVSRPDELSPRTQAALQTFRSVISKSRPLQGVSGTLVEIDARLPSMRHTFNSLRMINILSVGYVLGQQGYRDKKFDPIRKSAGNMEAFVAAELDLMFVDIRDIGVDLQFLDPGASEGGGSRFRDGNLFTYSGNGDDLLDLHEGVELLSFLFSGKDASLVLHRLLEDECPSVPGGVFGTKLIEIECFKSKLRSNYDAYFSHLPGLVRYLKGSDAVSRNAFLDQMIRVAKANRLNPVYMELLDTDVIAVLPHYLEATYLSYDFDRNGRLNTDEALAAFPKFEPVLKRLANDPKMARKDLEALFTYLLDRGKAPETTGEKLGYLFWKWQGKNGWKLNVQRKRILDIFEQIQ